jgi:ABC-type bacteriocin/lantibiotic exporter with double-glycine peptidase domain
MTLHNGCETVLTSHGDSLDPGQRFRLSLARALVRDPALLIIEEPHDKLDDDSKALLSDAYDRICRERTVIFLPGRMSTLRRTNQIIVFHEGKVVEMGEHSKLVTQSPVYRHWEYVSFNDFR